MKSLTISLSSFIISILCFCACNQGDDFNAEPELSLQSSIIDANKLQAEADSLYLPISIIKELSEEAKQRWKSSLIISEHTDFTDNKFHITISEEEANKLGVSSAYYHERLKYQDSINDQIAQIISAGKTLNLTTGIKETVNRIKKYKDVRLTNKTTSSISRARFSTCEFWPFIDGCTVQRGQRDTIHVVHANSAPFVTLTALCEVYACRLKPEIKQNLIIATAETPLNKVDDHFITYGEDCFLKLYLGIKPYKENHYYMLTAYSTLQLVDFLFYEDTI